MSPGALLWAALVGLQGPGSLVIRSGDLSTPLPVLQTQRGPMVRLEDGLSALGAALIRVSPEKYRLVVGGAEVELTVGLAAARTRNATEPLAAPPTVFEGKLLVPLALLTDVLPRMGTGFSYVAATSELRRSLPRVAERNPEGLAPPAPRASAPNVTRARVSPAPRIVVVDAGHGGPDRGMSGPIGSSRKVMEKDITLGVAVRLRDALRRHGVQVVMTRARDTLIALGDRGRMANQAGGSVFVSIHVNAANPRWREPGAARGFETYFLSEAKTEDERRVEALENEAVKFDGTQSVEPGDPLSFILTDMYQNEYLRESSDLALAIQRSLSGMPHPGPDRGVKQAGFLVLVKAFMPAVLVEVGFGSNKQESNYLSSDAGQRSIADAIAEATIAYLERLERKTRSGGQ